MELNAEQIKRALRICWDTTCSDCEFDNNCEGHWQVLENALTLINSQEQRIKELTEENDGIANICKANDTLISKLQEENKKLTINMNAYGLTAKRLGEENERLRAENKKAQISIDAFRELADKHALQYELRADKVKRLERFKNYFDDLFETGLEVANWYENGELKPFDEFYISALDCMRE